MNFKFKLNLVLSLLHKGPESSVAGDEAQEPAGQEPPQPPPEAEAVVEAVARQVASLIFDSIISD